MGLTNQSTGSSILESEFRIERMNLDDKVIALAGNPNVGKSTVFNSLTGMNQHTGNWPGKTVTNAQGRYKHRDKDFILVDIPGTYSLMANSAEEEVARDFILFGNPDATVIVTDATCLERNLNLVLQTLEITPNAVVCLNLLDEAKRKRIRIDLKELSNQLGVPVIGTSARNGEGLEDLMDAVNDVTGKKTLTSPLIIIYDDTIEEAIDILETPIKKILGDKLNSRWVALKLLDGDSTLIKSIEKYINVDLANDMNVLNKLNEAKEMMLSKGINHEIFCDKIVSHLVFKAEKIFSKSVTLENDKYNSTDRKIDSILASKTFGIPIMLGLLCVIFWITITGANYPSELLANFLFHIE
ncbi:MAG: FeoB small GTPase domain-containing protein, partial [Sedimentibacter sp.]|uniref:FeoB small GTPase domain-containing protein n=1 Tax=Sedimentibacter sp. TaxID=1960295 RepID=UPI002981C170